MPQVTVLMPAYNVEKYIAEAVDSILNQTFKDFVLLIMDDCSTDSTASIVASFDDHRIRYEKNSTNLGLSDNLNRGFELAVTQYIARMDGDDIAHPRWLEYNIDYLESHPDIDLCGSCFQYFGTKTSEVFFPQHHDDIMANMLFGCSIIVPVFRKEALQRHGLMVRKECFPAEDYRFWAEWIRLGKMHNIQKKLFRYRMHESQICSSKVEIQKHKANEVRLFMLEWLNPDIKEEDRSYFLDGFTCYEGLTDEKLLAMESFALMLRDKNKSIGHFSDRALERRFKSHLLHAASSMVKSSFFKDGFNIKAYRSFSKSVAKRFLPMKYRAKLLVKSLIRHS